RPLLAAVPARRPGPRPRPRGHADLRRGRAGRRGGRTAGQGAQTPPAGRVPADGLAIMRTCVADGEFEEAVDLLTMALNTGRLPLTEDEALLARAALELAGEDPGTVDLSPRLEELPNPPYTFTGV